jgi:hypothetical protein
MYNNNITEYDFEQISYIEDAEYDSFKLLSGQYTGVVLSYGAISFTEPLDKDAKATLKFEYAINYVPSGLDTVDLESDIDFNNYVGDILSFVLDSAFTDGNYKIGDTKHEHRDPDNNFTESD